MIARDRHKRPLAARPRIATRPVVVPGLITAPPRQRPIRLASWAIRRRHRLGARRGEPVVVLRIPRRAPVAVRLGLVVVLLLITAPPRQRPIRLTGRAMRRRHRLGARRGHPVVVLRIPRRAPVAVGLGLIGDVLHIAALARTGAISLLARAGRRVERDLAVAGDAVIARTRLQRAVDADPRRRLVLDGLGLALAFVEHLAAGAVRRYRLLAAMRLSQFADGADHHVAVRGLRADICDRHGLGLGRLAQPVVEHHAVGAAQSRRSRRSRFARQARQPHLQFLDAVAVAVGALNPRDGAHTRDRRCGDQRGDRQPRRPAQTADAPRSIRAAGRAISSTPPPPPLGRTSGRCGS